MVQVEAFARDPTCMLCLLLPFGACDWHRLEVEALDRIDERFAGQASSEDSTPDEREDGGA